MDVETLLNRQLLNRDPAAEPLDGDSPGLHVCPECSLPFMVRGAVREVVGVDWARVDLHCANCGHARTDVLHDKDLASLDEHCGRAFADLLWTLEAVWVANEEAAIERFAAALHAGAILPEDF